MKIIKIIFLTLLALGLIACMGVFILFQTFDTDQYLSKFTQKASLALGRPVTIGHVGLGLSLKGITLDVGPVIIADDPEFTAQPFMTIDRIRISPDFRSMIFKRKINITHICVQSPQIHFIRNQEAQINASSILSKSQTGSNLLSSVFARNPKGDEAIPKRTIDLVEIASSPESAALDYASRNDTIKSVTIQDAAISFIDQSQGMPLDIWIKGINASVNDFSLTQPFRLVFDGCFYSHAPNVHASTAVFLDLSQRSIAVTDLRLLADFSRLDMDGLRGISPEMRHGSMMENIAGVVQLNMAHLDIIPSKSLEASGDVQITGGVIKKFNIIKILLSHTLGTFGIMESNINNLFKGQLKGQLDAEDTMIKKAQALFSIHDNSFLIDDSSVQTNIFEFTAKGAVDHGLDVDMQTVLYLNADVSAALVNEFGGMKFLCDDSKRIVVDASLTGVVPRLKYKPNKDFRKKSRKALMQEGGNILGALLGGTNTTLQIHDDTAQGSGKKTKIKFKDILKGLLK